MDPKRIGSLASEEVRYREKKKRLGYYTKSRGGSAKKESHDFAAQADPFSAKPALKVERRKRRAERDRKERKRDKVAGDNSSLRRFVS